MLKEFKEFALKGNVMDMAVGIIIGAAFGKIVSSFVSDVIMPPIGLLLGKVDFNELFINLSDKTVNTLAEAKAAGAPVHQIRGFYQHHHRFCDHRLCDLSGGPADQPFQKGPATGAAQYQGMLVLLFGHPDQGDPLSPVHLGIKGLG